MEKRDRFLMETYLMNTWHITDDLDTVIHHVSNSGIEAKEQDTLLNMLIGLKELYHVKHQQLFELFEELIEDGTIT